MKIINFMNKNKWMTVGFYSSLLVITNIVLFISTILAYIEIKNGDQYFLLTI